MALIADFPLRSSPFVSVDRGYRHRTPFARLRRAIALPLVLASLAWSCPVLSAHAESGSPSLPTLEGRWVDEGWADKLVLDISACGEGWCGVKVADGSCGATVLRVKQAEETQLPGRDGFTGKLELAAGAQPYFVKLQAWRTAEADRLEIIGDSRGDFSRLRRWYPFTAHMVRRGNAECRADAKTS
jgi:hypothetical protein